MKNMENGEFSRAQSDHEGAVRLRCAPNVRLHGHRGALIQHMALKAITQ